MKYYLVKCDKTDKLFTCNKKSKYVELTPLELDFIYEDSTSVTVKDKVWEIMN